MKKFISMFLAVVMVAAIAVTAIPTSFAAVAETDSFKIGDTGYASLQDALNNAKDGDTIVMLKDYVVPRALTFDKAISVTIDGTEKALSVASNGPTYIATVTNGENITLKNMTLTVRGGFHIQNGALNFDNVTAKATWRPLAKADGGTNIEVNVNNSSLTMESTEKEPLLLFNASSKNVLNVTGNSTLTRKSATRNPSDQAGNCSVINIAATGTTEINVESGSKIVLAQAANGTYGTIGIQLGGTGAKFINLEKGSMMVADTACPSVYFYNGTQPTHLTDKGCLYLTKGQTLVDWKSGGNTHNEVYTYKARATTAVEGYTTYDIGLKNTYAANTLMYTDSNGAKQTTTTLATAISGAKAGSTISFLANYTEEVTVGYANTIGKSLYFNGNGFNLTFNGCIRADGQNALFPLYVNGSGVVADFRNFGTIHSNGGGCDVGVGTFNLSYLNFETVGRACFKEIGNGSTVNVEQAVISTTANARTTESPVIMSGAKCVLNLKNGAVLKKNQASNNSIATQANVLYFAGSGTHTINMESGSKMVANHAIVDGKNQASIIGRDDGTKQENNTCKGAKITLNMEVGSYLVLDSSAITSLWFLYNNANTGLTYTDPIDFTVNAYDGAFLVKSGVTTNLNYFVGGSKNDNNVYYYKALATSPVTGYTAYKMETCPFIINNGLSGGINLKDAISKATAGATIKMIRDFSSNETNIAFNKDFTLDLNKHTYTTTNTYKDSNGDVKNAYWASVTNNVKIQNGNLITSAGFSSLSGTLTVDNVVWKSAMNVNNYMRPFAKVTTNGVLNINNSTITEAQVDTTSDGQCMFLVEETNNNATLNVTGSTTITKTASLGTQDLNNAIFGMFGTANKNTVNIGSGVKLINTQPFAADNKTDTYATANIIALQKDTTNNTINIYEGAEIIFNRDGNNSAFPGYIIFAQTNTTHTLNNVAVTEGATFVGFKLNNKFYKADSDVFTKAVDAKTTLTSVYYTEDDFDLIDGASIRTVENENGIRFSTYMSNDLLTALGGKDNVTMGTYITPGDTTTTPSTDAAAIKIVSSENFNTAYEGYEGMNVYNTAIIMEGVKYEGTDNLVPDKEIYNLQLVAQSYFTVTYADGSTETFYTTVGEENVRSMAYVAEKLLPKYENATDAAGIKIYEFMQAIVNAAK